MNGGPCADLIVVRRMCAPVIGCAISPRVAPVTQIAFCSILEGMSLVTRVRNAEEGRHIEFLNSFDNGRREQQW